MRTTNGQTRPVTDSQEPRCADLVRQHYTSRMGDLRALWHAYQHPGEPCQECQGTGKQANGRYDCEYCDKGTYLEDSRLNEYGLSFDYVPPGTFTDQRRGYWRYQLSWGGPSDEFRFYADENKALTRVEYWYMDWFDGAKVSVAPHSRNGRLLGELWQDWSDMGSVQAVYNQAMEDT